MSAANLRAPAVAGRFYPAEREALLREIARCEEDRGDALRVQAPCAAAAIMAPHAGYRYSGAVAAQVFAQVQIPERVVVLSPNHTGRGPALSAFPAPGVWETPLGEVEIDSAFSEALLRACPEVVAETEAHSFEHGVEVELPFLQRARPGGFLLTALVLRTRDPKVLRRLGEGIAAVIEATPERVLLVVSTDMNHFDSDSVTRAKDAQALAQVEARDPDRLLSTCREQQISMCGVGPMAAVLHALAALRSGRPVTRIDYRTSGEVDGAAARVVGYASAILG